MYFSKRKEIFLNLCCSHEKLANESKKEEGLIGKIE